MNVSAPFIRRPIATSLLVAAIFLAGLAAFPFLPVAPLPSVEFPTLTVTANYPGASPQTMATAVATPLHVGRTTLVVQVVTTRGDGKEVSATTQTQLFLEWS